MNLKNCLKKPTAVKHIGSHKDIDTLSRISDILRGRHIVVYSLLCLTWFLLRVGEKPSRISYPCQRAALSQSGWFLGYLLGGVGLLLKGKKHGNVQTVRLKKSAFPRTTVVSLIMIVSMIGTTAISYLGFSTERGIQKYFSLSLSPIKATAKSGASDIFAVADCPKPNPDGSDRYHQGLDTLLSLISRQGLNLYNTSQQIAFGGPDGLLNPDDIVLIKINYQWDERGGTNTDVLKGLMRRVLEHPDGFTGEVVLVENIQLQPEGKQITDFEHAGGSNAELTSQSPRALIDDLKAEGYEGHLSGCFWANFRIHIIDENNHTENGYVRLGESVAYPKFTTENGNRVDLRHGLWNGSSYEDRVRLINVPVLKDHALFGVTAATKNFMGVPTVNYVTFDHSLLNLSGYLGRLMVHVRYPDLNIIDAIYMNAQGSGPGTLYEEATNVNILLAGTDPIALDYYAGKYVLFPVSGQSDHHPDEPRIFREYLQSTADTLRDYGYQPVLGDSALNLYVANPFGSPSLECMDFQFQDPTGNDNGELNSGETADLIITLKNRLFGADALGIVGTLSSDDLEISLIDNTAHFGDITIQGIADNSMNPFIIGTDPHCTPHWVMLSLIIQADESFTDTLALSIPVGDPVILLVDDDGNQDIEWYYKDALQRSGHIYSYLDRRAKTPAEGFSEDHETIIWFTGACTESTLTQSDQSFLSSFLNNGGRLFLSGQNIGADLAAGGGGTDFLSNYLHAAFISDASGETFLYRIDGDPISGGFTFFTLDESQTSPSIVSPLNGASPVLVYQISRQAAAIKFEGEYKVVYFAFGFEGIHAMGGSAELIQAALLNNIINWLNYTPVTGDVTQDGAINVLDVLAVINHILGNHYLQGTAATSADCNGDGGINVLDALGIVNVILGVTPECPGDGSFGYVFTSEALDFLSALRAYYRPDDFARFMALVKEAQAPEGYTLEQNYPNPFNPTTDIRYQIIESEYPVRTTLKIFNILGQEVRTLVDEFQHPGYYQITWDGEQNDGGQAVSGIYFYRLRFGTYMTTKRMVLMK